MRASVIGIHSPAERVADGRDLLDGTSLNVSLATGSFAISANRAEGSECLLNTTPPSRSR